MRRLGLLLTVSLPAGAAAIGGSVAPSLAARPCDRFSTQLQAQRWFRGHGGSPQNNVANLDSDHDGMACERLPDPAACGRWRWTVKTLQDDPPISDPAHPRPTTIKALRALHAPSPLRSRTPREKPWEYRSVSIPARLSAFKLEPDQDIHLVVADRHGNTMIVELPNIRCARGALPPELLMMKQARGALVRACGRPSPKHFISLAGKATIIGVPFFDFVHRPPQRGVAPNGIELHPVLQLAASSCRRK